MAILERFVTQIFEERYYNLQHLIFNFWWKTKNIWSSFWK